MRTFFLIPGFKQRTTDPQFTWLKAFLRKKGFRAVAVPNEWKNRTISDVAQDFKEFYKKHKSGTTRVLGFSYGAVIALLTANELKPRKIYLCSLSPDFKEDAAGMRPWIRKYIGKRRFQDAGKRSGRKIARALKIPSVVFYGTSEGESYPRLKVRCEETAKLAGNSRLVVVGGAPHKLSHPEYAEAIKQEMK